MPVAPCYAPDVPLGLRLAALATLLAAACSGDGDAPPPPCDADVERGVIVTTRGAPATVCAGGTLAVYADVHACAVYRDGTSEVEWSTDRPEVAVVHADGTVVGTSPGEATIAAHDDGASHAIVVRVEDCGGDAGADAS